jgi:hypothetical protein
MLHVLQEKQSQPTPTTALHLGRRHLGGDRLGAAPASGSAEGRGAYLGSRLELSVSRRLEVAELEQRLAALGQRL